MVRSGRKENLDNHPDILAEQVWIYDGTNTLPINIKSNTLQFKKSVNDKLISYSLSFDYAYDKINNIL